MTDFKDMAEPLKSNSKFPKWIIYLILFILLAIGKQAVQGCIREKAINDALERNK